MLINVFQSNIKKNIELFNLWEIGQNQTKKILIKTADQIWINMWLSKLDQVVCWYS